MLKSLLVVGLLGAVCFGREIHPKKWHPLSDQMINFINKINTTWKAGRNFDESISMSYIRGLLGVHPKSKKYRLPEFVHDEIPDDLPESFDAREKWSHCNSIHLIRDQSSCGSCWALGAAEAISDRVCIHSKGKIQVNISAEDLIECCHTCGAGCEGGYPAAAWKYWKKSGLVTGGLYGTSDGCKPYSLAPCEHLTRSPLPNCTRIVPTPKCVHLCRKGYGKDYQEDKHFGKTVYSISKDEKQIQTEIFKNGPVEGTFFVYADFFSYKSGVYQHHSGDWLGMHAIRILGWGTENGTPYWLVANSWNEDWGDHGMQKSLLIGGIAVAMAFGSLVDSSRMHPLSDEMVEYINKMNTSWKAGRNFDKSIPMSYILGLMGVLEESKESRLAERIHEIPEGLPDTFDARQKWANCKSIDLVRDQSACGSCWAFGAVEAMSDRVCIHSNGRVQVDISAEDLMDCCDKCGSGCSGGVSAAAWQYWKDAGLVSGGLYNTTDGCKPYSLAPCEHSSQGSLPECVGTLPTPKCKRQCREGYERSYDDDKYFAKNVYSINGSEKQIRTEIFQNGPVEAEFTAYADFLSYKSGVYQHHSRDIIGRHAIRILGWGSEDNNPYWPLANSWNEDWGDHGYFKMLRGVNECDIESFVNAGIPKLD